MGGLAGSSLSGGKGEGEAELDLAVGPLPWDWVELRDLLGQTTISTKIISTVQIQYSKEVYLVTQLG